MPKLVYSRNRKVGKSYFPNDTLGVTKLGGESTYVPSIPSGLIRVLFREQLDSAKKRIKGHYYKPSDAYGRKVTSLIPKKLRNKILEIKVF